MFRREASDLQLRALLVLLTLAVRVPYWRSFDLVTFDGAFYVNQAKALLHFSLGGGVFSIGYPLVIAPVMLVVRDGVLAARLVSLLAAIGSVLLMYELSRRFVGRALAFVGAFVLSVTPLFILISLLSNAESLMVFWLMLTTVLYTKWRPARAGLAAGLAAATRPEALAVVAGLGLARLRAPRGLVTFVLACIAVYAVNVLAISMARESFTPLSRGASYRSPDAAWQSLERRIDPAGTQVPVEKNAAGDDSSFAVRLPRTLLALGRQLLPLVSLLALVGMVRRPSFVLAMLLPLPLLPLFTLERDQTRYALLAPYLPPLIFYAMVALDAVKRPRGRVVAIGLVLLSTVICFVINRSLLKPAAESEFRTTRDAARRFAANVSPGDLMADRKPYFALYSGARYVEIPAATYNETIDRLAKDSVRYLSLHPKTVILRPALLPLMYDASAVRGESRYRQVLVEPTGEMIFERVQDADSTAMRPLTESNATDFAPAWSPDGTRIAFRRVVGEQASIWVMDQSGTNARELVGASAERDPLAWSPDGHRIAYASLEDRQLELFEVDAAYGRASKVFESLAFEWSPSFVRATGALVFCGDPDGVPRVWMREKGRTPRAVDGSDGADLASVAPSGNVLAWIDVEGRLVLLDMKTMSKRTLEEPRQIVSAASWSPDETFVAVEAYDWGSSNLYIVDVDTGRALMLSRAATGVGMPSWSPRGNHLACLFDRDGVVGISLLGPFSRRLVRLAAPDGARVFERPAVTRVAPRETLRRVRANPPARR